MIIDTTAKPQYGRRLLCTEKDFHISRIYCLRGVPTATTAYKYEVNIYNRIFSGRPVSNDLTSSLWDEEAKELEVPYRKGF